MIMETGPSTMMIMVIRASRISLIIAGQSMMASNHGGNLYHYPDGDFMYSYHLVW